MSLYLIGPDFSTFLRSTRLYAEELGIDYQYGMQYQGKILDAEVRKQLNPFEKVPVLIHDQQIVYETIAICFYLDELGSCSLIPAKGLEKAKILQWSSALVSTVDPVLIRSYLLEFTFPAGTNGEVRMDRVIEHEPSVIHFLKILSHQLGENTFFLGNQYSIPDAILTPMIGYLSTIPERPELFKNAQNLLHYYEQMSQRPSGRNVLR